MRLLIRHVSRYHYEPDTLRAALMLRLWPTSSPGQTVLRWSVQANGHNVFSTADGRALLTLGPVPETLEIVASGVVETADVAGVTPLRLGAPHPAVFLKGSRFTTADPAIDALAQSATRDTRLATLHALNDAVRNAIDYRPGATAVHTTAGEALAQGTGVCQDHAHVFIAAARSLNIPARYVVGYLLASIDGYEQHETHAWAEAFVEDLGWVGFDAANGVCPDENYVRLTDGLDAMEAAPIRGHISGGVNLAIDADVRITPSSGDEADEEGQRQQQQQQSQSMAIDR